MSHRFCRYPQGPILRDPLDLEIEGLATEDVCHVATARVVVADYDVLQNDFPELRTNTLVQLDPKLRRLSPEDTTSAVHAVIDDWLIANAAFISTAQAGHSVVNTPISIDDGRTIAYRPPRYGRAVVVPTQRSAPAATDGGRPRWPTSVGLLDLKGAGVSPQRVPANGHQSSGLEYLGLAIGDFFLKKAIDEIFARELPYVWTVPVYAVLDLGFDVVGGFHGNGPAGMHIRRAHRRPDPFGDRRLEHTVTVEIEDTLRRFGITAATRGLQIHISRTAGCVTWQIGTNRPSRVRTADRIGLCLTLLRDTDRLTLDCRDVQLANDISWPPATAQMVDFGALRVESWFDCPMIRGFDKPGLAEIIWPTDPRFIQPDPDLQLPLDIWRRHDLAARCFMMANDFRRGAVRVDEIRQQLDGVLTALVERWAATTVERATACRPPMSTTME